MSRQEAARCDRLIVHTDIARNELIEGVGVPYSNISMIPQPSVPPPAATSSSHDLRTRFGLDGSRVLLAFGFIRMDKGLDDLIQALKILRDTKVAGLDNVRLVVAGDVRPRAGLFRVFEARDKLYVTQMLRRIKRTDLQEIILLTGYVPDGEVATWFEVAEALVLPYRRIEHSMVAGLARSLNVPVLSSTAGGLAEQFVGSKWTFPPRAPARIAATLEDFLSSAPAERICMPMPQHSADFASVAKRTLELYGEVTSGDPGRTSYVA